MSVQELRRRKEDDVGLRLEGHEDLCEERYKHIDTKLDNLDGRLEDVKEAMVENTGHINKKFSDIDSKLDRQTWGLLVGMAGILAAILFGAHL